MAQFTIRIPDEMRDRIRQAAAEDRRSMNAEIEWLLDTSLSRWLPDRRGKEVRPGDGNSRNNDPSNLVVADPKENGDA
jgi:hypothetical protein